MNGVFKTLVHIKASSAAVWEVITTPMHMQQWMGDEMMNLLIAAEWIPGTAIIISGITMVKIKKYTEQGL